jgi:hypothetical protein
MAAGEYISQLVHGLNRSSNLRLGQTKNMYTANDHNPRLSRSIIIRITQSGVPDLIYIVFWQSGLKTVIPAKWPSRCYF